jgi:hypothetical protein
MDLEVYRIDRGEPAETLGETARFNYGGVVGHRV